MEIVNYMLYTISHCTS